MGAKTTTKQSANVGTTVAAEQKNICRIGDRAVLFCCWLFSFLKESLHVMLGIILNCHLFINCQRTDWERINTQWKTWFLKGSQVTTEKWCALACQKQLDSKWDSRKMKNTNQNIVFFHQLWRIAIKVNSTNLLNQELLAFGRDEICKSVELSTKKSVTMVKTRNRVS